MWRLLAVFLAALVVRGGYVLEVEASDLLVTPVGDERAYEPWARDVAAGRVQPGPLFQAPAAAWAMGGAYAAFGVDPSVARWLHALFGALTAVLLADLARRCFGVGPGLLSGWLWALYAPAIFHAGRLEKPALGLLLVAAVLHASVLLEERSTRGRCLWLGAALSLAGLAWESAWILAPWVLWPLLRSGERRREWPLVAAGVVLGFLPQIARNLAAEAPPLATTTNLGPNLWVGNNPGADGFYSPLVPGQGRTGDEREDARELAEREAGRPLDDFEVSAHWRDAALTWWATDPLAASALFVRKLGRALRDHEWMDSVDYSLARDESVVLGGLGWLLRFGTLLALATVSLSLGTGGALARYRFGVPALLFLLGVASFFVFGRLRLTVALALVPLAGAAPGALREAVQAGRRRRAVIAVVLALVVFLLSRPWSSAPASADEDAAASWNNVATVLRGQGDSARALGISRRAAALAPTDPNVQFSYGELQAELAETPSDVEEAARALGAAATYEPAFRAEAEIVLAGGELRLGLRDTALARLNAAARLPNTSPEVPFRAGLVYSRAGELEMARRAYAAALELRPDYPDAASNLGWLYQGAGRYEEAVEYYERALATEPLHVAAVMNLGGLLLDPGAGDLQDPEAALGLAGRLQSRTGPTAETLALTARALLALNRGSQAREALLRAQSKALEEGLGELAEELRRLEASAGVPPGGN